MKRHYLDTADMLTVQALVRKNGLRPMVEAVGAAALQLLEEGEVVKDGYGDPMDEDDVRTAAHGLQEGDLY